MWCFQQNEFRQVDKVALYCGPNDTSLGHQRSLMFYIPTADILATSFKLEGRQREDYRAYAGDGIFRLSVGIEDPQDLCADLEQALDF